MKLGKDAMFRQQDMAYADAMTSSLPVDGGVSTEDIQEGVTRFFKKREPEWKGR